MTTKIKKKHPDFTEEGLHKYLNCYFGPQSNSYKDKNVSLYWLTRMVISDVIGHKSFIDFTKITKLVVPKMVNHFISDISFYKVYGISKNSKILLEDEFE